MTRYFNISALGAVLNLALSAFLFAADPSGTSREVQYKKTDIVPMATQIRFTTLIELPEAETILEATCGDKEYWAVNWTGNLAYVKPAKEKARTNINLVTQAGHVYSFIATEVSGTPTPADLKLFVTPTDNTALITRRDKPRFVPAADLEKEKKRADDAEARLAGQQADAHKEIAKERVEALATVTAKIEHDYKFKLTGTHEPFNLTAMYHDDRFTYIEATPTEPPAIYEVKDGKDSLIQFEFDEAHHRYTIPKVLDQGYLRVGKTSLKFKREKAG
jgi:type IV secretion system protein VirB9